jgi:predicted small secreted protein
MAKKSLVLLSLLIVLVLQGCATVRGMAEDVENLGRGLKKTVSG